MDQAEINKRNEAITLFMGYKFTYLSEEDFSDIGGLETKCKIYSKIPLEVDYSLDSIHWRDDRDKFFFVTLSGWDINPAINELKYNSSWDWLMPVVEKIEKHGCIIQITFCLAGSCRITKGSFKDPIKTLANTESNSPIEAVFLAVSDYCLNQINP
jgi:Pyruvate/2-oxoacid:ferredoxin oxidoreductase delta subunit